MTEANNKQDNTPVPVDKRVLEVDAFPFKGLKISEDWNLLETVQGRTVCSSCQKSRKYFCYTCHIPVSEIQHIVPKVKLPVKVDIIKHAREMDGKSTAVHAAVLAPEYVRIFTYPCIPDYEPHENVVLIFPNKDAVSVEEICDQFFRGICAQEPQTKRQCLENSHRIVHRAVFIDSTWNQSRGIFKDPRIKGLPSVVLKSRLSQFWRHQADSPRWYLATVEAIHQFLVELDAAQWKLNCDESWGHFQDRSIGAAGNGTRVDLSDCPALNCPAGDSTNIVISTDLFASQVINKKSSDVNVKGSDKEISRQPTYSYSGQYDNLLFFFRFMYSKIHTLYEHDDLKSYKRRLE